MRLIFVPIDDFGFAVAELRGNKDIRRKLLRLCNAQFSLWSRKTAV